MINRIDSQDSTVTLEELIPIKSIGSGMCGNVILAIHKEKKVLYAIKSIERSKIHKLDIYQNINLERKLLMQLDHAMIIKLIKTFKD